MPLCWIRGQKAIKDKLVKRRISVTDEYFSVGDVHHVKSKSNSADCTSRGLCSQKLTVHELWFNGPQFLQGELPLTVFINSELSAANFILRFSTLTRLVIRLESYSTWGVQWLNFSRSSSSRNIIEGENSEREVVPKHDWLSSLNLFIEKPSGILCGEQTLIKFMKCT